MIMITNPRASQKLHTTLVTVSFFSDVFVSRTCDDLWKWFQGNANILGGIEVFKTEQHYSTTTLNVEI